MVTHRAIRAARMTSRDDFTDESTLIEFLAGQLRARRLGLVLGAGMSFKFGLPGWGKLVDRLFAARHEPKPKRGSLEQLAEYFRRKFFPKDKAGFVKAVHDALYEDVDCSFIALRSQPMLAAIGSIVMASQRGNV